jgi:hypothetical protein
MSVTPSLERAAAVFLTRTMIGFVYLFSGIQRLGQGGASDDGLAALEIMSGALLLVGFWTRPVLRVLAVMVVGVTIWYGVQGLSRPGALGPTSMDINIVDFYILPRAALIIINLFIPAEDDVLSLDAVIDGRVRRVFSS